MPKRIENIEIDLDKVSTSTRFTAKQYEDIELVISLINDGVAYDASNCVISLHCNKQIVSSISIENGKLIVIIASESLIESGLYECELSIADDNGTLKTPSFYFNISTSLSGEIIINAGQVLDAEGYTLEDAEGYTLEVVGNKVLKYTAAEIDGAILKVKNMPAEGIVGPKGDKGEQGIQGVPGIQGPKGDPGANGTFDKTTQFSELNTSAKDIPGAINENASQIADITQQQATDLSLNGTTLKLKKADGTTIGTGVTLPTSGGSVATDLTGYQTNGSSIGKKGARSNVRPLVSFTDDDGNSAVMTKWLPIIQSKNIPITLFIITDSVGTTNCLTWEQLRTLQNDYGCEIASHTLTHTLGSTKKDFRNILKNSKEKLMANGLKVNGFAYPSGSYYVESVDCSDFCREHYEYAVITLSNKNIYPISNSMKLDRGGIGSYDTTIGSTLDSWKAKVDDIYTNGGWFIFMTHIGDTAGGHTDEDTTNIGLLIDYIKSKNIDIVTIREGYEIYGNVLETPSTTITNQGKIISQDVNVVVPKATKTTEGIVKVGDGISVADGLISVDNALYYNKTYLDGILDNYESRITVLESSSGGGGTNNPPIVSTIANIKTTPSTSFAISYTAVDSDGILAHELSSDNGVTYNTISPSVNGSTFTYTTSIVNEGVYYYKLRVTDNLGAITVKSFSVTIESVKILLSNSTSTNGGKVSGTDNTYFVNGTGGWNMVALYDDTAKLTVGQTYTACYELVEFNLTSDPDIGSPWKVTESTTTFDLFKSAREIGVIKRVAFTYKVIANSEVEKLIYFQLPNTVTTGSLKFKFWIE